MVRKNQDDQLINLSILITLKKQKDLAENFDHLGKTLDHLHKTKDLAAIQKEF
jgi:hypothetical protein